MPNEIPPEMELFERSRLTYHDGVIYCPLDFEGNLFPSCDGFVVQGEYLRCTLGSSSQSLVDLVASHAPKDSNCFIPMHIRIRSEGTYLEVYYCSVVFDETQIN